MRPGIYLAYFYLEHEQGEKINDKGNSVLAVYVNDRTYKLLDKLDEINFDDYLLIYSVKSLMKDLMAD